MTTHEKIALELTTISKEWTINERLHIIAILTQEFLAVGLFCRPMYSFHYADCVNMILTQSPHFLETNRVTILIILD